VTAHPTHHSLWQVVGAAALSVIVGVAMASQARVNGALGQALHNGTLAGTISNCIGLTCLIVIFLLMPSARQGWTEMIAGLRSGRLPWLFTLAGSAGAIMIASQGIFVGVVGVAIFTVALVAGNTLGGLFMDKWGIGPAGKRALTARRISGVVLAIVAVVIASSGRFSQPASLWPIVVAALIGVWVSWQQAANGRITAITKTPVTTTFVNFIVGTGVLFLVMIPVGLTMGLPESLPTAWWLYLGGPLGVFFVAATSIVVRVIGVLVFGLCATLGQLATALVLDLLFPGTHYEPVSMLIGVAVLAVAVVIASTKSRRAAAA
jgi:transporter family-2 protein